MSKYEVIDAYDTAKRVAIAMVGAVSTSESMTTFRDLPGLVSKVTRIDAGITAKAIQKAVDDKELVSQPTAGNYQNRDYQVNQLSATAMAIALSHEEIRLPDGAAVEQSTLNLLAGHRVRADEHLSQIDSLVDTIHQGRITVR